MAKRKRPSVVSIPTEPLPSLAKSRLTQDTPGLTNKARRQNYAPLNPAMVDANPKTIKEVLDGREALRSSPDAAGGKDNPVEDDTELPRTKEANTKSPTRKMPADGEPLDSSSSDLSDAPESPASQSKKHPTGGEPAPSFLDPEGDAEDLEADPEESSAALGRPPPVNSSYLPLPWKGRLGYACLNTYLRSANPPIFSSRTCRIASILENRHPLRDPKQPPHATKNRPDKDQPANLKRGQAFVEGLGLANARDIPKMLRWNERYGIRFLRLSSEMFPFASHHVYGYRLAPFAAEALAEAGRVAAELGHRVSTHPGQFTQLGSPRKEVIDASIRDLKYHAELLSLLALPSQLNKDAVMILHMGGVFGDKECTLDRFRSNYARLDENIKNRLVLENDDVCYSVHDLLPVCEELNIPLVLDFHHHNIVFDADKIREGTSDIMDLYPRILATWTRKGITPKMHYSEPTAGAITGRQRRKHNPRPATLPPCPPDMDLMIEAKDKEQAVFELMRTFKLPGFNTFSGIIPHVREDENKAWKPPVRKKTLKKSKKMQGEDNIVRQEEPQPPPLVPEDEVGMGGPLGRVYWPPGMEEWLRPKKREVKKKDQDGDASVAGSATPAAPVKSKKAPAKKNRGEDAVDNVFPSPEEEKNAPGSQTTAKSKRRGGQKVEEGGGAATSKTPKAKTVSKQKQKSAQAVTTPSASSAEVDEEEDVGMEEGLSAGPLPETNEGGTTAVPSNRRQSRRRAKKTVASYAEDAEE